MDHLSLGFYSYCRKELHVVSLFFLVEFPGTILFRIESTTAISLIHQALFSYSKKRSIEFSIISSVLLYST